MYKTKCQVLVSSAGDFCSDHCKKRGAAGKGWRQKGKEVGRAFLCHSYLPSYVKSGSLICSADSGEALKARIRVRAGTCLGTELTAPGNHGEAAADSRVRGAATESGQASP